MHRALSTLFWIIPRNVTTLLYNIQSKLINYIISNCKFQQAEINNTSIQMWNIILDINISIVDFNQPIIRITVNLTKV